MIHPVEIADDRWMAIADIEFLVERVIGASLAGEKPCEVSVLLANDKEIRALNKQWRGQDKPTNVLSFPSVPPPRLPDGHDVPLGDIVLAIETVAKEAEAAEKRIEHHVSHLIVHGILHLLGYDHQSDPEAETMEARERKILAGLGISDPYVT
jgi:probable rRNA maturation factor